MGKRHYNARVWREGELTGGPVDQVFAALRRDVPDLLIERLVGVRPDDDDNVYFIGVRDRLDLVQLGTYSDGQPPFSVESNHERLPDADPGSALGAARAWLRDEVGPAYPSGCLDVDRVFETRPGSTDYVVRCIAGVVRPGDRVGAAGEITAIVFAGEKPVDRLDPPHSAKVTIAGGIDEGALLYTFGA